MVSFSFVNFKPHLRREHASASRTNPNPNLNHCLRPRLSAGWELQSGAQHRQAPFSTESYLQSAFSKESRLGATFSTPKPRAAAAMATQDVNKKALEECRLELVNAGHEGPSVSIPIVGLGVYLMPSDDAFKAVSCALQHGYRHIDTAHLYGNEKAVGDAIRASNIPREEIFVTTKLWNSDHGYASTLKACDRSLKELRVDYVDLYLVHSPLSPPQKRLDTWRAMEKILKSGKARSIGVSNYGVHHLKELFSKCEVRPAINQVELHPFNVRKELVDFCLKENIVVEAYSPLTRGQRLNEPALVKIAENHGKTTAQVLIRWCVQKNYVTIPKSVKPARILENSQVFDFELTDSEMAKLDSFDEGFAVGWDPTKSQ
eukprot:c18149_g1_i1 orf=284-1405(-)